MAVAHDQQAIHQLRTNRRTPNRAEEIGEVIEETAHSDASMNVAQEVIGWDVIFDAERIKQSLFSARQLSRHASNPPAGQAGDLLFQHNRTKSPIK